MRATGLRLIGSSDPALLRLPATSLSRRNCVIHFVTSATNCATRKEAPNLYLVVQPNYDERLVAVVFEIRRCLLSHHRRACQNVNAAQCGRPDNIIP